MTQHMLKDISNAMTFLEVAQLERALFLFYAFGLHLLLIWFIAKYKWKQLKLSPRIQL